MYHKFIALIFALIFGGLFACVQGSSNDEAASSSFSSPKDYGGGAPDTFKVPVPSGFDWEVTQGWAEDCKECSRVYKDWDYCNLSHSTYWIAKYGWDFNLPGNADLGKAALATADGYVREEGHDSSWGNYLVLDHGQNICSRYAHFHSRSHLNEDDYVCQGMRVGEIGNSGASDGAHLHFQFEDCDSGQSIAKKFTDGNDAPTCVRGQNRYDSNGNYDFLRLTNREKNDCRDDVTPFGDAELNENGWVNAYCGSLDGCPLIPNCGRQYGHRFDDHYSLSSAEAEAAAYLWSECALDGKSDGGLHPNDDITRAEALKVPMFLYGTMDRCGASSSEPFSDVDSGDWYFGVVACAVTQGLISNTSAYFRPNAEVSFAEAAKFVVESAVKAGVIRLKNPASGHFKNIPKGHWAYKYAETLWEYGGITGRASKIWPDDTISRGDYVVMVASLSPCFCRNVSCMGSCVCEQDLMACVDKNDNSDGTGGYVNGEPMDPPEEDPPPSDPPPSDPPPSDPPPSDPPPSDPPPSDPPWQCIPGHIYEIDIWSFGGFLEIFMPNGPIPYYPHTLPDNGGTRIGFDCADLPATMLITSATNEIFHLNVVDDSMTSFSVWEGFNGSDVDRSMPPDFVGTGYTKLGVSGQLFVKFPAAE